MSSKQMEGDDTERRDLARKAREHGKKPSAVRATLGSSSQRQEAQHGMEHQERIDLERAGKHESNRANIPTARPRSRDLDVKREAHPRMHGRHHHRRGNR